jgi:hypothetical protein
MSAVRLKFARTAQIERSICVAENGLEFRYPMFHSFARTNDQLHFSQSMYFCLGKMEISSNMSTLSPL